MKTELCYKAFRQSPKGKFIAAIETSILFSIVAMIITIMGDRSLSEDSINSIIQIPQLKGSVILGFASGILLGATSGINSIVCHFFSPDETMLHNYKQRRIEELENEKSVHMAELKIIEEELAELH